MDLSDRAVGQYPISIATSLAIESLNGVHPEIIVETPPILDYLELWINVRTLIRNIYGSLTKEAVIHLSPPDIAYTVVEEIDMIRSIIRDSTNDRCTVVFYYSNYANINTEFKHAILVTDNTEKQRTFTQFHNKAVELLLKTGIEIKLFDLKIKSDYLTKALILTHFAIDLLSHKAFSSLTLIESHTGKLKDKGQFYTKFVDGKDLVRIPFNSTFLQIFGDGTIFRPFPIKNRREIIEIADKYSWSQVTTHDKLMYGIDSIKDPYFKTIIKHMMHEHH